MVQLLKRLLEDCEKEHKASGMPAEDWSAWYAAYLAPRLSEWQTNTYGGFAGQSCPYFSAQMDVRSSDGITEG
jgi:hypothetical protein